MEAAVDSAANAATTQYHQITGRDNARIHAGDNYISSTAPQVIFLNGNNQDSHVLLEHLRRVSGQLAHLSPGAIQHGIGSQNTSATGQTQPTIWERLAGAVDDNPTAPTSNRHGNRTFVGANSTQPQHNLGYVVPQALPRPVLVLLGSLPGLGPDPRDTVLFDTTTKRMKMWFQMLPETRRSFFSKPKTDFYLAVSCNHSQLIQGMIVRCAKLKSNVTKLPHTFQWPGKPVQGTTIHILVFLKRGWTWIGEGSHGHDTVEGRQLYGHYTNGITFSFPNGAVPTSQGYFSRCTMRCCADAWQSRDAENVGSY